METNLFTLLSLVIVLAVAVSAVMRLLRQPPIMGYILTGVLLGPSLLNLLPANEAFTTFSSLGITLLLFIIGLGLNTAVIKKMGKAVLITSAAQMAATLGVGFLVASSFGFNLVTALVIGISLMFSSTIIILKILNDKREQNRLYAQISIGVLLIQDVVASLALVLLATNKSGGISPAEIAILVVKGAVLIGALLLVSNRVLRKLTRFIAGSQEFLFMFSLAWGFGIATLFELAGFSLEVGALFAGVSLASLPYAQEAASRLKPLRDFFVVVFFIALGEGMNLQNMGSVLWPTAAFTLVVVLAKPLGTLASLGALGYTKNTSFKTALTLGQVSEFSLVFIVMAANSGLVSTNVSSIITLVAVITIATSTYFMKYDDNLLGVLESKLRLFERKVVRKENFQASHRPIVLFGYHKGGPEFIKAFRSMKRKFVVVDYNPEVIEELERQNIDFIYGDATDLELLEELNIGKSKLIVSTIADFGTNKTLLTHIMHVNPNAIVICHSDSYEQAAALYRHGAAYVMMPHLIGSERISNFVKRAGLSRKEFDAHRNKHLTLLESQLKGK
jgi:Kef-type K+ transport system membrane component KefB